MSVQQQFNGPVNAVAARDIHFANSVPPQEWEVQERFRASTGIDCNKEARLQLEYLMEWEGFTALQLRRAWKQGSLRWDSRAGQWAAIPAWIDNGTGRVGYIFLTLVWVGTMVMAWTNFSVGVAWMCLGGSGAVYLGSCLLIAQIFTLPQRTARLAITTLAAASAITVSSSIGEGN